MLLYKALTDLGFSYLGRSCMNWETHPMMSEDGHYRGQIQQMNHSTYPNKWTTARILLCEAVSFCILFYFLILLSKSFFCAMQINFRNFLDVISISEKAEELNLTPQSYKLQPYHSTFSGFPLKTTRTDAQKPRSSTAFSFLHKHSSFCPTPLALSVSPKLFFCPASAFQPCSTYSSVLSSTHQWFCFW